MADEPKQSTDLPPWAKQWGGIILSAIIAFLAARYGITPTPLPIGTQSTPTVLVIHSGGGQPAYAGTAACQCPVVAEKK
jgi:hypothetical protein